MDIQTAVLSVYPKATDCIEGHIGDIKEVIESELADDRYYQVKVQRCSHCNMPCGSVDYV